MKVFERVPGATIEGTAPANTTVRATVELQLHDANTSFTYRQFARSGPAGEFTMVVPYATTGYESWGPQAGYTNGSVRATGPYTISTMPTTNRSGAADGFSTTVHVSEAHVIGETESNIRVSLDER